MTDRSRVIQEMHDTMEELLVKIEEHFDNDPAFREAKRIATEMKQELEEVLESFE